MGALEVTKDNLETATVSVGTLDATTIFIASAVVGLSSAMALQLSFRPQSMLQCGIWLKKSDWLLVTGDWDRGALRCPCLQQPRSLHTSS
ncbi:hypothetical protein V6N11_056571 [Hibiscus sabdariffa]|uniref:Uncharacterized protein n=1 Tax=Hibiscus sabdariffa TaxID=183260 RepID=A0ABR2T4R6_9ROSI